MATLVSIFGRFDTNIYFEKGTLMNALLCVLLSFMVPVPHVDLVAHLPKQRATITVRAFIMKDGAYVVGPKTNTFPTTGGYKEWTEVGEKMSGFIQAGFLNWYQNHTAIGRGRVRTGIVGNLAQEYPTVYAESGVDNQCTANGTAPPIIYSAASCQAGGTAEVYYRVSEEEQGTYWVCKANCKFTATVKSGTPPFFKEAVIQIGSTSSDTTHLKAHWDDQNNQWVVTGEYCSWSNGQNVKRPVNKVLPGYSGLSLYSWEHSARMSIESPCKVFVLSEYVSGGDTSTIVNTHANNYNAPDSTTDEGYLKAEVKVLEVTLIP